jgi:NitT/TauT family transport system ATP-binding protein
VPADARPIIALDRIAVRFGGEALYADLSFSIADGEFLCILGPSGCGKSTLLRLIGGLLASTSGTVEVVGEPPARAWRNLAYVFQSPRLVPWRSALDNVVLAGELRFDRADRAALRRRAGELLDLVGLTRDADKFPAMLSGGERQRVAIARALVVEPRIILMDEPFSALDLNTRERLRAEILAIWRQTGKTIVFVTHDIDEAVMLADRIVVLSQKPTRVLEIVGVAQERPRDLRTDPALAATRLRLEALIRRLETASPDPSAPDRKISP